MTKFDVCIFNGYSSLTSVPEKLQAAVDYYQTVYAADPPRLVVNPAQLKQARKWGRANRQAVEANGGVAACEVWVEVKMDGG